MKPWKYVYWIATAVFSGWMLLNAIAYMRSEKARQLCIHFGFPQYFRVELSAAKLIGILFLLLPVTGLRLREWAYAGFFFTVVSGFIAHLCSGDGLLNSSSALVALFLLLLSYYSYHHLNRLKHESSSIGQR